MGKEGEKGGTRKELDPPFVRQEAADERERRKEIDPRLPGKGEKSSFKDFHEKKGRR